MNHVGNMYILKHHHMHKVNIVVYNYKQKKNHVNLWWCKSINQYNFKGSQRRFKFSLDKSFVNVIIILYICKL